MKNRIFTLSPLVLFLLAFLFGCSGKRHPKPNGAQSLSSSSQSRLGAGGASEPGGTVAGAVTNAASYVAHATGPHSRAWERVTWRTNAGRSLAITNQYIELSTGLYRRTPTGWAETSDQITIQPDGGAVATNCQYNLYCPGDPFSDAFRVTTPDSKVLVMRPAGLAFSDGKNSVFIGEVKEGSTGQLLPSGNQIIYPDLCSDVRVDLLANCRREGFESFVVLREQLPDPRAYGLPGQEVLLQWWTEILEAPQPNLVRRTLPNGLVDNLLVDFGDMKMVPGRAFLIGDEKPTPLRVPISKDWTVISNRVFLVEQIPLSAVADKLAQLPRRSAELTPGRSRAKTASHQALPPSRTVAHSIKPIELAQAAPKETPGFALDYALMTATATNYTFTADSTTLIRDSVQLHGTTVIEGGACLKFSNNLAAWESLVLYGPLQWKTKSYHMAALTSQDDDSVGDPIANSTHQPSTTGNVLMLDCEGNGASGSPWVLSHARFSYAIGACFAYDGSDVIARNCQFVHCPYGIGNGVAGAGNVAVYNGLFTGCEYPLYTDQSAAVQNVTAVDYTNFCHSGDGPLGVAITNSILASDGRIVGAESGNPAVVAPILDHTTTNNSAAGLFQQVGGAAFYLAAGSPNRNSGTTNVDAHLLADLRSKTTYPPVVISNTWLGPAAVTLSPQVQRDTDEIDRGWQYDPLDYCFGAVVATNCDFTVTPGTAIGLFGVGGLGWGLNINSGANVLCHGTPTAPIHITGFTMVQEKTNAAWLTPNSALVADDYGLTGATLFDYRFTDFSCFGIETALLLLNASPTSIRDCQFHGGYSVFYFAPIGITNCLFDRHVLVVEPFYNNLLSVVCNSLFFGGGLEFSTLTSTNGVLKDNLFIQSSINFYDSSYQGGYNAFVTNRLFPTNLHDVILTNTAFATGPLGSFYYPTNGDLARLLNAGSTNANLLGLYHFTVMTNLVGGSEIPESNSLVEIGFHYVAVDSNGRPLDSDADGTPDYAEDINGSGSVDSGETDWQSATDLGLEVHITVPKAASTIP